MAQNYKIVSHNSADYEILGSNGYNIKSSWDRILEIIYKRLYKNDAKEATRAIAIFAKPTYNKTTIDWYVPSEYGYNPKIKKLVEYSPEEQNKFCTEFTTIVDNIRQRALAAYKNKKNDQTINILLSFLFDPKDHTKPGVALTFNYPQNIYVINDQYPIITGWGLRDRIHQGDLNAIYKLFPIAIDPENSSTATPELALEQLLSVPFAEIDEEITIIEDDQDKNTSAQAQSFGNHHNQNNFNFNEDGSSNNEENPSQDQQASNNTAEDPYDEEDENRVDVDPIHTEENTQNSGFNDADFIQTTETYEHRNILEEEEHKTQIDHKSIWKLLLLLLILAILIALAILALKSCNIPYVEIVDQPKSTIIQATDSKPEPVEIGSQEQNLLIGTPEIELSEQGSSTLAPVNVNNVVEGSNDPAALNQNIESEQLADPKAPLEQNTEGEQLANSQAPLEQNTEGEQLANSQAPLEQNTEGEQLANSQANESQQLNEPINKEELPNSSLKQEEQAIAPEETNNPDDKTDSAEEKPTVFDNNSVKQFNAQGSSNQNSQNPQNPTEQSPSAKGNYIMDARTGDKVNYDDVINNAKNVKQDYDDPTNPQMVNIDRNTNRRIPCFLADFDIDFTYRNNDQSKDLYTYLVSHQSKNIAHFNIKKNGNFMDCGAQMLVNSFNQQVTYTPKCNSNSREELPSVTCDFSIPICKGQISENGIDVNMHMSNMSKCSDR